MDPNSHQFYDLILKINKGFYDKLYTDTWLKDVFIFIKQEIIETQQTDFIVGAFGGPSRYCGRNPKDAHPHMVITKEMWELREKYLKETFLEVNCPQDIQEKWLKIDESFKKMIIQEDLSKCEKRYKGDYIIHVPNPNKKAA